MIYNYSYNPIHHRDSEVINYLKQKNFKVVDIGASYNSWSNDVSTAVIDAVDYDNPDKLFFKGDINSFELWSRVLEYVDEHGKFDFSICTHTLEDISNPGLVVSMLSKISNNGFISFPSKYAECPRHGQPFRGWMHHRWIFNYEQGAVIAYPKLPFTEYLDYLNDVHHDVQKEELSFFWSDTCDIQIINNDFFPSEQFMVNAYKNLLDNENNL
jgi:hypothetical protein